MSNTAFVVSELVSVRLNLLSDTTPQIASASAGVPLQAKPQPPAAPPPPPPLPPAPPQQQQQLAAAPVPWRKARIQRSNSDPVLMDLVAKGLLFFAPLEILEALKVHSSQSKWYVYARYMKFYINSMVMYIMTFTNNLAPSRK